MKQANPKYTILYARLSQEDSREGDSNSIQNQQLMLEKYANDNGFKNPLFLYDDGYSGTNYDRPDFKRLENDIEIGKVGTVITKDLSRLGRDYLKTGYYTEIFFPEYDVRYIAVHDGVDTLEGDNEFMPFKNIINEWYARDCSRKVKAGKRAKALNGQYTGSYAPYGYMKSPEDKHKLIPDIKTVDNLKRIFQMAASGLSPMKIGNALRRDKILKPRAYTTQETSGKYANEKDAKYPYDWSPVTIIKIVQNQAYLGHLVFNKFTTKSFKTKKIVATDENEWIIAQNTHEPLVDEHTFEQAQKITVRKRRTWTGEPHIFAGLLRCPDCEQAMHHLKRTNRSCTATYSCNTYSRYGKEYCTMHYIRYEDLYDIVLSDIRQYAELAKNHEQEFVEALNISNSDNTKKQLAQYEKEIVKAEKRLSEISIIIKRLYEDSVIGKLTDERFCEMSKGYETENADLKEKVREAQKAIASYKDANSNSRQFTALIQKYFNVEKLDAPMLNELVSKIEVHEREITNNGERVQKIDIYYNFVGIIDKAREHRTAAYHWVEGMV